VLTLTRKLDECKPLGGGGGRGGGNSDSEGDSEDSAFDESALVGHERGRRRDGGEDGDGDYIARSSTSEAIATAGLLRFIRTRGQKPFHLSLTSYQLEPEIPTSRQLEPHIFN